MMTKSKPNPTQVSRLADTPIMYRAALQRTYEGKSSPRAAIKSFCLQCVGEVRADVTNCRAKGCPLFAYRPFQQAASVTGSEVDEGIDASDEASATPATI
jgi:hypothetical protein